MACARRIASGKLVAPLGGMARQAWRRTPRRTQKDRQHALQAARTRAGDVRARAVGVIGRSRFSCSAYIIRLTFAPLCVNISPATNLRVPARPAASLELSTEK